MLETEGYEFPDRTHFGIDFKNLDPGVFTQFVRAATGKLVNVVDQNPGPGDGEYIDHKYTVTVEETATKMHFTSEDPIIRNYG